MIEEVIMINCSRWLMAVGVAGLVTGSRGETFTLKEADHPLMLECGVLEWEMAPSPLQNLRPPMKAPEGAIEPKIKVYYSPRGAAPMLLLFKSSKEAKSVDRAIFDANGNSDFTDDQVLALDSEKPVDVKWQPKGREAVDYRLYLVKAKQGNNFNVALLPMLWREGTITLAGKPVRALLHSSRLKTLVLDSDGDGKFDFSSRDDQVQLTSTTKIKDTFYKTITGPGEDDLSLEKYTGPLAKLEFTGELVAESSKGEVEVAFHCIEPTTNRTLQPFFYEKKAVANQPIVVPAGEYTISAQIATGGEKSKSIGFRLDKKIVLSPEQVTKIVLDNPKAELVVTQKDRKLTVNRKVIPTGDQGVTYSMGRDKEPLVVDVVDPADQTKVLIGRKNMEYG